MTAEMFDSIDPRQIPAGQDAAGYVDGRWPTFTALHGPSNLSIAVFAADDADTLDVEAGDATNSQAPGWVKRELGLGHWRPCVYTSASNVRALLAALAAAGISRSQIRLWTAHYTYRPHLCGPACGLPAGVTADATQWTDRSGGRNLDESTIADDFFSVPTPEVAMAQLARPIIAIVMRPQNDGYWLIGQDGGVFAFGAAPALTDPVSGKLASGHLITDAVCTPSGAGLILVGADGGTFALGDAVPHGSIPGLNIGPASVGLSA